MKHYAALILALLVTTAHAEQDLFGVHAGTYHSPNIDCSNGKNPGLFYRDAGTGLTLGTYFNSCERQSYYIGWVSPDWHGLGVMVAGRHWLRAPRHSDDRADVCHELGQENERADYRRIVGRHGCVPRLG